MADNPSPTSSSGARRPRADAERNRLLLLAAAKSVFARDGAAASLEEIARTAGVGIGTLYRHFPNREALIEAVYRQAMEQLAQAAEELAATHPPVEALRAWLKVFVDYLADKQLMAGAMTALGDLSALYAASGEMLTRSVETLAQRAEASGEIKLGVTPFDLLRAVGGLANANPGPGWEANAKAMVDIMIAGMRRG